LHPLEVGPGFAAAIAVPPAVRWATNFAWQPDGAGALVSNSRGARRTRLPEFSETGSTSS
jgi:hypothetical protein